METNKLKAAKNKEGHDDNANVDELALIIGDFGLWQLILKLICGSTGIFHAWQMLANKFLTYPVDHWCARPDHLQDLEVGQWLNLSAPVLQDGSFDKCHVFSVNYSLTMVRPDEATPLVACGQWEYDTEVFQNTATSRWDLVCDSKHIPRMTQTIFFIGTLPGVLLSGFGADKFGRKTAYLFFMTLWIVSTIIGTFSSNLYLWIFTRFIGGMSSIAFVTSLAVFGIEITSGKWRSIGGHLFGETAWQLGIMSMGIFVYFCRDMKVFETILGCTLIPYLSLWYFLPESPRWLLAVGQKERARVVILQACKVNKKPTKNVDSFIESYDHTKLHNNKQKKASALDLFRWPAIRRNTLVLLSCWLGISMGYFGLAYNTPAFNWNIVLVFVFPAFLTLPAIISLPFFENKFGRKASFTSLLLVAGIMLLLTAIMPKGSGGIIACAWIGTVAFSLSFGIAYNFTKELFPTVLRTTALSLCSAAARIGSILSPFVGMLSSVSDILPLLIYGGIIFIAACLSIWIWPETKSVALFDTIEECEKVASSRNTWISCCKGDDSEEEKEEKKGGKVLSENWEDKLAKSKSTIV